MLFSNDTIAAFLNREFECAWEMVRPVPKVEIDFGDGRRLHRTLSGNIATYFCLPDGRTFDLLPGLVAPGEFLRRAKWALGLYRKVKDAPARRRKLTILHEAMADVMEDGPIRKSASEPPDLRKRAVEAPLKKSLREALRAFPKLAMTALDSAARHVRNVESPRSRSPAVKKGVPGNLFSDTKYNRANRYPLAHRLLARRLLEPPAAISKEVFRKCLHIDLDDPYLGLAPYVLGGEDGREAN